MSFIDLSAIQSTVTSCSSKFGYGEAFDTDEMEDYHASLTLQTLSVPMDHRLSSHPTELCSDDYFGVKAWETSNVFSDHTVLGNIAKTCSLQLCAEKWKEVVVYAGYCCGKLFLQQNTSNHVGGEIITNPAVTVPLVRQYVSSSFDDHEMLIRSTTECANDCTHQQIASIASTGRRSLLHAHNSIGGIRFYQDQWLKMILSGKQTLAIGRQHRGSTRIDDTQSLSLEEVAERGGMLPGHKTALFEALCEVFATIERNFEIIDTQNGRTMLQAEIVFTNDEGEREMSMRILNKDERIPMLSSVHITKIRAL